jgi:hypothetical protein
MNVGEILMYRCETCLFADKAVLGSKNWFTDISVDFEKMYIHALQIHLQSAILSLKRLIVLAGTILLQLGISVCPCHL